MAKNQKKTYEDDDGRIIADMSEVTRPNLWSFRHPSTAPWHQRDKKAAASGNPGEEGGELPRSDASQQFSKEDRRAYILAALAGAFAIAAVFAIVFAIVIILIGHAHR